MTVSEDGYLTCFMGPNLTKPLIQEIKTPNCPATALWILAATFMPYANVIALSTSNHDLLFYTYGTVKFERASRINQLPAAVTALTYHCDASQPRVKLHNMPRAQTSAKAKITTKSGPGFESEFPD